MNIGSLEVLLGVNTAGLSRAAVNMKRFETQVLGSNARMQNSFQQLGSQMMLTGTMVTQYLTVPISLLGGAATTAFAKFETQLAKIVALTGTTQGQVNTWSKGILNMSKEFGQAPKDIASAMYFIATPALKASTSMEILKAATKGAAIGLGETETIASTLVSVINAYGESNISASKALDIMVSSIKYGKLEAQDLANVIGKVLPVAQVLGVSFGDVSASLVAMTLTGKSASEAATQLTRLFTTLIQAPPRAEKVLNDLGISFSSLRTTLREGGIVKFIEELNKSIGNNKLDELMDTKTYTDNVQVVGDVFTNLRALLPVLDMLGPNMKNWTNAIEANNKAAGDADTAWSIVSNTVSVKFANAIQRLNVSLINVGSIIKGSVINLVQTAARWIENLVRWFTNLSSSTQSTIITLLGIVAAIGPVLVILGTLTGAFRMLGSAIMYVIPIIQAAWAACAANPLAALGFALAGVIALFNIWYQSSNRGTVAQQELNKVTTTALQNTIAQKQELESLVRLASNEHATLQMKKDAIAQINAISPEYLGFIDEEAIKTGKATEAIKEYMLMLTDKAKLQAAINNKIALESARLADLSSGQDKRKGMLGNFWQGTRAIGAAGGALLFLQNPVQAYQNAWDNLHATNANESEKLYNDQMSFYDKLIDDLKLKIEGAKIPAVSPPLTGVLKIAYDAAMAKAKLEEAAKSAAQFWKEYAGMDTAGKMRVLSELMLTANGKELNQLAQKWVALNNIKDIQDDLIEQAKNMAANTKLKTRGDEKDVLNIFKQTADVLKNMYEPNNAGELKKMNPFINFTAGAAAAIKSNAEFDNIVQQTQIDLFKNAEAANKLGEAYSKMSKENDINILQSAIEKLTAPDMMSFVTPEQLVVLQKYLSMLDKLQEKQQNNTKALAAWKSLFNSIGSLMGDLSQYMSESFQKVWNTIQSGIQIISDVIGLIKGIVKVVQAMTTAETIANGAKAAGIPIALGAAAATEAQAIASEHAAIAGAAASTAWIPIVGVGLALAGIVAISLALSKSRKTATGMAEGGMVPDGFPNDSFPAMLTSGETVIPLNKVGEMFGKGQGKASEDVTFRIEGRTLVAIAKNINLLNNSF